ncbi:hypothetical protein EVAR_45015_1 [Eumeta japonica]|uniref:Uncharacterized protein n=1 Tax=Eumeta variegata TaxID=151549 RepID=A0A4C1XEU9_EUMVA|nr:hypothetical protein EVAR_45015_1 [Eumeta japonica]
MIWNIDETSCMTATKTPKIIAARGAKQVGQIISTERSELVSAIFFINAAGKDIGDITIHDTSDDDDLITLEELVGWEENLQKDKDDCVCQSAIEFIVPATKS